MPERWTAKQIAQWAGIGEQSGRWLVSQLKLKSIGRDQNTGAKLYDAEKAKVALDDPLLRPGRGRRTDLREDLR